MNIPTIQQIYQQIIQDYENRLGVTFPTWGRNFIKVHAMVNAMIFYAIYLKNAFVYRNMLPDTADSTANGGTLERFGMIMLNRLPFRATQSQYSVLGTGAIGSTIPAGRTFTTQRNNVIYTIDVPFVFTSVPTPFVIRSLTAGTETRLFPGDVITIVSPVTGVTGTFVVQAEVTEPTDAEPLDSYRAKILQAYRYRSRGGAAADYRFWAGQVVGVRNSYPYTGVPLPNVNLYIESETGDGVPSPALLTATETHVNQFRPMGIYVHYLPVVPVLVAITVQGAQSITTTDQTLIYSAMEQYLREKRPFIESTDTNRHDVVNLNEIIATIQDVKPNVSLGNITVTFNGSQMASYMVNNGEIPKLDTITYVQ